MNSLDLRIRPVRPWDLFRLTQMAYDNMTGVDVEFTRFARNPILRTLGYAILPLYLLTSGKGYKAVVDEHIEGCAFLHVRRLSGLIFNVSVNQAYRRRGIAQALMARLENETQAVNRPWSGLQVDKGNGAAQELYLKLGYRPYHPYYLYRPQGAPAGLYPAWGLQIEPVTQREGTLLFREYARRERQEGDGWAASVVQQDYAEGMPPGGRPWRCLFHNQEVGCVWRSNATGHPLFIFLLERRLWDDASLTTGLLYLLLQKSDRRPEALSVHLGSSSHYAAARPVLQKFGFSPRRQARILMLKSLRQEQSPERAGFTEANQ